MAHIQLLELAEVYLRPPNTVTSPEREMIAGHASYRSQCDFCQIAHQGYLCDRVPAERVAGS